MNATAVLPAKMIRAEAGAEGMGGMAFAWFVFDRRHCGPTELHRLSWEEPSP